MTRFVSTLCLVSLSFLILTACVSTHKSTAMQGALSQEISKGMTPEQVRAALGDPVRVDTTNGEVRWMVYGSTSDRSLIYFANGRVKSLP